MQIEWFAGHVLPAAFALLPTRMDSPEARALVTAICLQESALKHQTARRRLGGYALIAGARLPTCAIMRKLN